MRAGLGPSSWGQCQVRDHFPGHRYQRCFDSKGAPAWERKHTMFVLSGQFCPGHSRGARLRDAMGKRWLSQEELAHSISSRWNFSWRHTAAAGLKAVTEVFWTSSLDAECDASERDGGQVVGAEGKAMGLEEVEERSAGRVTFPIFCLGGNFQLILLLLDITISSRRDKQFLEQR